MKQCKNISCWTDYPFAKLGDIPNCSALIRQVCVTAYDGDKYATITVKQDNTVLAETVKIGYLYSRKVRYNQARDNKLFVSRRKFERMIPTV